MIDLAKVNGTVAFHDACGVAKVAVIQHSSPKWPEGGDFFMVFAVYEDFETGDTVALPAWFTEIESRLESMPDADFIARVKWAVGEAVWEYRLACVPSWVALAHPETVIAAARRSATLTPQQSSPVVSGGA